MVYLNHTVFIFEGLLIYTECLFTLDLKWKNYNYGYLKEYTQDI